MERTPLSRAVKEDYYNKCVIGIPTFGAVSIEFLERLFYLGRPMNFGVELKYVKGKEVGEARNEIVQYALDTKARYVFFIDDDVLVPSGTLNVLAGRIIEFDEEHQEQKGRNIVYAPYFSKGRPIWPLLFTREGEPCDQRWYGMEPHLRECLFIGMGCTLIPIQAFEEMEPPWYETPNEQNPGDPFGAMIRGTEDAYFCRKVRALDWRIWADTGVKPYHFDAAARKAYGLHPELNIPAELDLGSEIPEWNLYPPIGVCKAGPEVRNFEYQAEEERVAEVQIVKAEKPKRKAAKKRAKGKDNAAKSKPAKPARKKKGKAKAER